MSSLPSAGFYHLQVLHKIFIFVSASFVVVTMSSHNLPASTEVKKSEHVPASVLPL